MDLKTLPRALLALFLILCPIAAHALPDPVEGSFTIRNFTFADGERLPALRIAYRTLGTPHRNAAGEIDTAALLMHGTSVSGAAFLAPAFADALFGPGKPLDVARWYIILPDAIGHGGSSKPSDGLRMAFPRYDYADMVAAQRRLATEHLGIKRLKLVMGTSMGGMETFLWATAHPGSARAFVPVACYPVAIAGQNRMARKLQIDAIKTDPAWQEGNYTAQPMAGLRMAGGIAMLFNGSPAAMQAQWPTRAAAEQQLAESLTALSTGRDANDAIYQIDASRSYDPWSGLPRVADPLLWINFADDLVNPVSLDIAPSALKRMTGARFHLVPASAETRGHLTLLLPGLWAEALGTFLAGID
jgi:homoserine O-acetyltransferase